MVDRSLVLRLSDIVEAIERIYSVVNTLSLEEFEAGWEHQWLVERGVLIISEASRHLSADFKACHPESRGPKWPVSEACCDTIMSASLPM
jgi:uncharacterized protein with HEPN domain